MLGFSDRHAQEQQMGIPRFAHGNNIFVEHRQGCDAA
jgi:hypothetical protein